MRVHGPDAAPTLILVHCWTGTQELWHKQITGLSQELRIVAYDHRGHGLSDDARDGDYSIEALAADLDLVIDATVPDGELPLLAGHSLGAMTIAAWAAQTRGNVASRARGAALLSTGLEELTRAHGVVRPLPGPFATAQGRVADLVLAAPGSIKGLPPPLLRAAVAYVGLGPDADAEDVELTTRMLLDCRTAARAGCGRAMSRLSLLAELDALDIPTIIVVGERDMMTPVSHSEKMEFVLPRSLGLRVDPNAGHMTPLEAPEVVNAALRELVEATASGSAEARLAA